MNAVRESARSNLQLVIAVTHQAAAATLRIRLHAVTDFVTLMQVPTAQFVAKNGILVVLSDVVLDLMCINVRTEVGKSPC